jgi:hypothetical protein
MMPGPRAVNSPGNTGNEAFLYGGKVRQGVRAAIGSGFLNTVNGIRGQGAEKLIKGLL